MFVSTNSQYCLSSNYCSLFFDHWPHVLDPKSDHFNAKVIRWVNALSYGEGFWEALPQIIVQTIMVTTNNGIHQL